jgi:hypothetical protein
MNANLIGKKMTKTCNDKSVALMVALGFVIHGTANGQVKSIDKNAPALVTEVNVATTDNLNPTVSEKSDAYGLGFKASGQLVTTGEGNWLMLSYEGEYERYELSDSPVLLSTEYDFLSYKGALLGRIFISKAWYVDAELIHIKADEKFGFGLSNLRNNVFLADERAQNQGSLNLLYGNDTSNRSISFKLSSSDIKYADVNAYSTLFNYKQQSFDMNIAFRQSSLTRLLFSFEAKNDNYDSDLRDDSRLYRILLGVDWRPSGKSKLQALLGSYRRERADDETSSGLSWTIDYQYQARQDLLFTLRSSRTSVVGQSEFASDSVNSRLVADLAYFYSDQWQIGANIAFDRSEYDEELVSQDLDEQIGRVRLTLLLKQHSKVWFDVAARQVSSTDNSVDYRQNEVRLSWRYAF